MKASLAGAGKEGDCCKDFVSFATKEIRQHLGLYVFQGINASPNIELKFRPQSQDKMHGNDFIYHSFGPNITRRHKHFKCFFACQDPRIDPPNRTADPNWKIRPLISWMNCISPIIWKLACAFSVDEMTMGFKGKHADKKRIACKAEGGGFQADALCQSGFCYQAFLLLILLLLLIFLFLLFLLGAYEKRLCTCKVYKKGLSPSHARVMGLFDAVSNEYHQCAMDNLCNSAAFCKAAFNHSKKVLTHGVARLGSRGVPSCAKQEEIKNRKQQIAVRGTAKAAVLKGDSDCPNLVASSVYDAKPVHYLSMVSTEIRWIEVAKAVHNVDTGAVETLRFLRLNNIAQCNKEMGNVDLADQLRGNCRMDKNVRNKKWW